MNNLRATLRLQFHAGFTLDDAAALVDYFDRLGISHIYASPLLKARPDSIHGYDVIDPTCINPDLGGEPALRRLTDALHQHGMGLIMDLVPNHMAVDSLNPWWQDVLLWGSRSAYAHFLDINWHCHDRFMRERVLLPILADDYLSILTSGDIRLTFEPDSGRFYLRYHQHQLPVALSSYAQILQHSDDDNLTRIADRCAALEEEFAPHAISRSIYAELASLASGSSARSIALSMQGFSTESPRSGLALHELLEQQHYRLASWRTANDDINWRRFFDINELIALRTELPQVFEATHSKVFELIAAGLIDGLRIDHIDGLADPHGYCRRLRRRVQRLLPDQRQFTLHVEKILAADEQLPGNWQVDGTTGYDFMNQVALVQHDPAGHSELTELWHSLTGRSADFDAEERTARGQVLEGSLAADFEVVAQGLLRLARCSLSTRDITLAALRRCLKALIIHYPAYRTYSWVCGHSAQDQQLFDSAMTGARNQLSSHDWPVLDQLQHWLGGDPLQARPPGRKRRFQRGLLARFHQLTAPAAAKAVEDTAFYRSAILLSRNEVGSDPQRFSADIRWFHQQCQTQATRFPLGLLATASHDHKRGEDARARLAVLSEHAPWFAIQARFWRSLADPLRSLVNGQPAPGPADELMLYQTLFAHWPLGLDPDDQPGCSAFAERVQQWQLKALREAKLRSSWIAPDAAYEQACVSYLQRLLTERDGAELRRALAHAVDLAACGGALNSLGQCLLRMTCPGVPDLYQGCEYWDFSMVDPDNRRPVDHAQRRRSLKQSGDPVELLEQWRDGRIKQWLIAQGLKARRQQPELFTHGDYQPLRVRGQHAERLIAFSRRHGEHVAISLVPRLTAPLLRDSNQPLIPPPNWDDTLIDLPATPLFSALTGAAVNSGPAVPVSELLTDVPVNLLVTLHHQENTQ
ncbi:MAG: malto-oligosyltrehalose synthase [Pseudomonas sp.]